MLYVLSGEASREYKLPDYVEGIVNVDISPGTSEEALLYFMPVYANNGNWALHDMEDLKIMVNGKGYMIENYSWRCYKVISADGKVEAEIYVDEVEASKVSFDKYVTREGK